MSLPSLASSVKSQDWTEVSDAVLRLQGRGVVEVRKWTDGNGYICGRSGEELTCFFNSGEFQLGVTAEGRVYMEALQERARLEKSLADASVKQTTGAHRGALDQQLKLSEEIQKALSNRTVFEQQTMEMVKRFVAPNISTESLQASLAKMNFASNTFYESMVENLKLTDRQYWESLALAVEPTLTSLRRIGEEISARVSEQSKMMAVALQSDTFQMAFKGLQDQAAEIAKLSVKIPDLARIYWPEDTLVARLPLIEDSIWNAQALGNLRERLVPQIPQEERDAVESVEAANHFVGNHVHLVGSIPPLLPLGDAPPQGDIQHRDEEIGSKLEHELERMGKHYVELRRAAWRSFAGGSIASARVAMAGIRELYSDVLRLLSADEEVKKTDIWLKRENSSATRPTRKMRLEFIVGGRLAEYDALVQFDASMQNAHRFTHTFSENPELVRVSIAQIEICLYLLLISARRQN